MIFYTKCSKSHLVKLIGLSIQKDLIFLTHFLTEMWILIKLPIYYVNNTLTAFKRHLPYDNNFDQT